MKFSLRKKNYVCVKYDDICRFHVCPFFRLFCWYDIFMFVCLYLLNSDSLYINEQVFSDMRYDLTMIIDHIEDEFIQPNLNWLIMQLNMTCSVINFDNSIQHYYYDII